MIQQLKLALLKRKCKSLKLPPYICRYLSRYEHLPKLSTPWEDCRFVVFDTETTGLDPSKDRVLSIGSVAVKQMEIRIGDCVEELVHQEDPEFTQEAIAIHGIIPSETRGGTQRRPALERFFDHLGPDLVVAHHVAFDTRMIEGMIQRLHEPQFFLYNHVIDTAQLAQVVEHPDTNPAMLDPKDYTLDALCDRYNIKQTDRHTAWGDAFITAKLLLRFLKHFQKNEKLFVRDLLAKKMH
ncbi:MAG: 3'-5' exonuclease [Bacteroidota bacterium]